MVFTLPDQSNFASYTPVLGLLYHTKVDRKHYYEQVQYYRSPLTDLQGYYPIVRNFGQLQAIHQSSFHQCSQLL